MSIYKGSRYTNTNMYARDDKIIFKIRDMIDFRKTNGVIYEYTEGDTIDGLAHRFYGDSQLWWIILESNVGYRSPLELKYGDELFIPAYEEVMKYV